MVLPALLFLHAAASSGQEVMLYAAASLAGAVEDVARGPAAAQGVDLRCSLAASSTLAGQIEQGAPADVFAAANVSFIEDLERQGRIAPGTKRVYARGRIVLWTRADAGDRQGSPLLRVEDLARPEITRVAIANPDHAPYGVAAREALQAAGVWEAVQPKLVLGENVRQALQYAETGNVDAAIVARLRVL